MPWFPSGRRLYGLLRESGGRESGVGAILFLRLPTPDNPLPDSLHLRVALPAVPRASFFGAVRTGAGRFVAARTDHLQVRELDRRFALEHAAAHVLLRVGLGVLLHHVGALDDRGAFRRIHAQHLALLAAVLTGEDEDRVVLLHVR